MKYSAFISYRRIGGAEKAELLKAVLCKKGYRAKDIFMDTYTIQTGNYVQSIEQAIAQSRNFIVIITKGCFDNLEEDGIWVHELKLAKDLGLNIIPVYFDGIRKLDRSDLPAPISDLPLDNAVIYSHDYADASYERICSFMVGPRHINWLKLIRNNVVPIITICVATVFLLIMYGNRGGNNVGKSDITDNTELQEVEFSTILSKFFHEPDDKTWTSWGAFSDIPGLRMTSDHLEDLEGEERLLYAPYKLSYEMFLTVNGKNVHVNTFGEKQPCELNLYGPHAGILLAEINIGYGLNEQDFQHSEIDKFIKLLYPNYQIQSQINKRGFDSYIYNIRDELYIGVSFEVPGQITEWTFYISSDYDAIDSIMHNKGELQAGVYNNEQATDNNKNNMNGFLSIFLTVFTVLCILIIVFGDRKLNTLKFVLYIGLLLVIFLPEIIDIDNKPYIKAARFPYLTGSHFIDKENGVIFRNHHVRIYAEVPEIINNDNKGFAFDYDVKDLTEAIYKGFKGVSGVFKKGKYKVDLYYLSTDNYGNRHYKYWFTICTLNASEIKQYKDYSYFDKDCGLYSMIYNGAGYKLVGDYKYESSEYLEAVTNYIISAIYCPNVTTYYDIADCYYHYSFPELAFDYLEKAKTVDADYYYYDFLEGRILYDLGRFDNALKCYDSYIEQKPESYTCLAERAHLKEYTGNQDGAIEDYTKVLSLNPDINYSIYSFNGRGDNYLAKGDIDSAINDYRKVVELDSLGIFWTDRMYAYLGLGEIEEAKSIISTQLKNSPNERVYYHAACFYARIGDTSTALYYLKESLENGYRHFTHIVQDDDLDSIKKMKGFEKLIHEYKQKYKEELSAERDRINEITKEVRGVWSI